MNKPLEKIHSGMKVYDSAGAEIGTVDYVRLSDENPANPVPETAGVSPAVRNDGRETLFENLAHVFEDDDLPEELKSRLLREGFVRMDAHGLFHADRYILPDQIQNVSGDRVQLNASRSELIKHT